MKRIILAAFALLTLLFASCTPPSLKAKATKQPFAPNVEFHGGYVLADFDGGAQAAGYFAKGGASICLPQKGQFEIAAKFGIENDGSLKWANNVTGEYLHLFADGTARAKVGDMAFELRPTAEKPVQ